MQRIESQNHGFQGWALSCVCAGHRFLHLRHAVCTPRALAGCVCSPAPFCLGSMCALLLLVVAGWALGPVVNRTVMQLAAQRCFLGRYPACCMRERGTVQSFQRFYCWAQQGLVWQGQPLLCNVFSKHDNTSCLSSPHLRQINQTRIDISTP